MNMNTRNVNLNRNSVKSRFNLKIVAASFTADELFRSAVFHARDNAQTLTQIRKCYDGARIALLEAIFRAQKAAA
jgi:hypothetical protein